MNFELTEYEKMTLDILRGKIDFEKKYIQSLERQGRRNEIYNSQMKINKWEWEYRELWDLYQISKLDMCYDLNGNILPSKKLIMEEIKNEEDF